MIKLQVRGAHIVRMNSDGSTVIVGEAVHDELLLYNLKDLISDGPVSVEYTVRVHTKAPDITRMINALKASILDAPPTPVSPMKTEGLPQAHKGKPSTYKPCPNGPPRCGSKRRRQW